MSSTPSSFGEKASASTSTVAIGGVLSTMTSTVLLVPVRSTLSVTATLMVYIPSSTKSPSSSTPVQTTCRGTVSASGSGTSSCSSSTLFETVSTVSPPTSLTVISKCWITASSVPGVTSRGDLKESFSPGEASGEIYPRPASVIWTSGAPASSGPVAQPTAKAVRATIIAVRIVRYIIPPVCFLRAAGTPWLSCTPSTHLGYEGR